MRHGAGLALALAFCFASEAGAQELDARALALADGGPPEYSAEARRRNPAILALRPATDRAHTIPVPLGPLYWAIDGWTVDPDELDFDLVEAVDIFLSSPLLLHLRGDPVVGIGLPLGAAGFLKPRLSRSQFVHLIDADGVDVGRVQTLAAWETVRPLGGRWGVVSVQWARVFQWSSLTLEPGTDTRSLFVGGPLEDGRLYSSRLDAHTSLGLSSSVSWARAFRLGGPRDVAGDDWRDAYWSYRDDTPRLAVGLTLRQSVGLIHRRFRGGLNFRGTDGRLQYEPDIRYARNRLDAPGDLAHDTSLDAGLALQWRTLEFGVGVADLFSSLDWRAQDVTLYDDEGSSATQQEGRTEVQIPASWRVDARWRSARTLLSVDWTGDLGGQSLRGAVERHLGGPWTLRGGLAVDPRGQLQGAGGLSWASGERLGLDLGLASHAWNFTGERDLAVGMNVFWAP